MSLYSSSNRAYAAAVKKYMYSILPQNLAKSKKITRSLTPYCQPEVTGMNFHLRSSNFVFETNLNFVFDDPMKSFYDYFTYKFAFRIAM